MAQHFPAAARRWVPSQWPGVERTDVGDHDFSGASLFRMEAGAIISLHEHPHGEHTYIIEGEAMFGDLHVRAGDALYTLPGEVHEVRALTRVVFLGAAPR